MMLLIGQQQDKVSLKNLYHIIIQNKFYLMFNSQSPSPQLGKSTYSSATRRDVLWNVVEPGDPYDIRKSMIAKLPGDRQHFMGDNLDIVCLFQSAEIQRLCQFLDDYKFRYRQIQRRELDRHSYEVQIKQLTQQLSDDGSLRTENSKLKDFIKKQTIQIEELKNNRFNVDNNLRANYESALSQIQALIKQNNFLKSQKDNYILQINNYSIRIQALQSARQKQLRQLFNKYAEENKYAIENETRSLKTKYQSEINRLQFQIKRLKQFNEAKNEEINELTTKNRNLILELEQMGSKKNRNDAAYIAQMEQRFALLGQQIQRLNLRIKQSTAKVDESARNQLYWKDKFSRLEEDYRQLQIRYKQSSEQYSFIKIQYEKIQASASTKGLQDQIARLKAELKRLEEQKFSDSQKYSVLQKQYNQLQYSYSKISLIERENAEMKANFANVQDLKRKIAEYQTKIALLSQQVQRLNYLSQNSNLGKQEYNGLKNDYEDYKRKSIENQRVITQRYESQMQRKVLEYESRLAKYAQESGNQFEIRLQAINREVERLNQYLRQKTQQSQFNKKRIRQLQNSINEKYEIEVHRQYATYELTIKQLRTQIQQVNRKYRDNDGSNKKLAEYQNRIALLTQEIERLNYSIRTKESQIDTLRIRIRQIQNRPPSNIPDFESSRKFTMYEETQQRLTRQNEDLKRRLQQIVQLTRRLKQYEDKIRLLTQENQRINMNLKEKLQMLNRSELNLRNITLQVESLRKNRQQIEMSYSQRIQFDKMQNSRKFTNYEQSLSSIQREYQQLRRKMMDIGNDSNRKASEYQNRIVLLTQQIERLNQTFKLKVNQYQNVIKNLRMELQTSRRETQNLQISITQKYELETSRKIGMYEQNLNGLNKQLEDLRRRINDYENSLRKKTQQINQLQSRYKIVSQQYQSYKFQVKSFQGEVNRSHSSYEQNLQKITRQYEDLKRVLAQYENRIALLSQENERLNGVIRNSQQQQQSLRRTINEMKIQIKNKFELEASRKTSAYEQNISNLNRQKEQLRRKLLQYENMIKNLNRQIEERNRKLIEGQNRLKQLQITITQKYQVQSNRKITIYEQNIQNITRELQTYKLRINEYEGLRVNYEKQINRLTTLIMNGEQTSKNQLLQLEQLRRMLKSAGDLQRTILQYQNKLRMTIQQNEDLKRKMKQLEITIVNKYQLEINQKSTSYEQNLGNFRRENDDLKRKIAEYENKIVLMTQQIERLNNVIKGKLDELNQSQLRSRNWQQQIENSRRKMIELEKNSSQRFESQLTRTISVYEQNITTITREYQQYKRQITGRVGQYETKIALLSQQLQRVNQTLRLRTQEFQKMQRMIRQMQMNSGKRFENEKATIISTYQQNITIITRQYEQYKLDSGRKISEYERKIMQMNQQIENLRRQLQQSQHLFNQKYELQISRKVSVYEMNFTTLKSQVQQYDRKIIEYNRRIAEYENKFALMTQQIERLNSVLKTKADQAKHFQAQAQKYALQLQNLKTNLASYYTTQIQKLNGLLKQRNQQYQLLQLKLTQLSGQDSEFKQLQSSYSLVTKQYQNSKKHLMEYQQSIRKLYSQFQRLQVIINELKVQRQTLFDKNHGLLKQIQRLTNENKDQQTQLYEIRLKLSDEIALQKRINQHMALMVVLFAEIETLRERVKAKQKQVQEVRRSSLAPLKA